MEEIRAEQSNNLDEITKIENDGIRSENREQKTELLPKKSNLKMSSSSSLQIDLHAVHIDEPNKVKIEEPIQEVNKEVVVNDVTVDTNPNPKKTQKLPVGVKSILIRINNLFVLIFIPLILVASECNL